jgi:hypothetical protein
VCVCVFVSEKYDDGSRVNCGKMFTNTGADEDRKSK